MLETIEYYDVQKERKLIREEVREELVKNMLGEGISIDMICRVTNLSETEI